MKWGCCVLVWVMSVIGLGKGLRLDEVAMRDVDDGSEIGRLKKNLFRGVLPQVFQKEVTNTVYISKKSYNSNSYGDNKKGAHKLKKK